MGNEKLSIFDLCLKITSAFEGASFGTIAGNFDGMGMSAGILQFNIGTGSLQAYILNFIDPMVYDFPVPITPLVKLPKEQGLLWHKDVALDAAGKLKPEWRKAWQIFMTKPEVIDLQKKACGRYFQRAREIAGKLGFSQQHARAMAWSYDVAVQSWSLGIDAPEANHEQAANILQLYGPENFMIWQGNDLTDDQVKLVIASHLRALKCRPEYRKDFFIRKCTIAVGTGIVHKTKHDFRKLFMDYP
jgi:hypothetical protein